MTDAEKKKIFSELKRLIASFAKGGVEVRREVVGSVAKLNKPRSFLYGKKMISIMGLPVRQTYMFGVIAQKHFVGFYSMPMYSHPKEISLVHPELKKARKGKSCLNITKLDAEMIKELREHIKRGIALYRKEGWI